LPVIVVPGSGVWTVRPTALPESVATDTMLARAELSTQASAATASNVVVNLLLTVMIISQK
jgi:hypothetical protein